jgi:transcriptional regulator with XRE-family HTH domain
MREKSPWSEAHITLKRLWDERVAPTGMSQEEFGEKFYIGTQGMVSQYLLGTRPLNYDAAAKFARGFGCSIEDICPEMARTLSKDIIPVLRRSLRRRKLALLAMVSLITALLMPQPVEAAVLHNSFSSDLTRIRIACRRWLRRLLGVPLLALAACATPSPNTVTVKWVRVSQEEINKVCADKHGRDAIVIGYYRGCSTWNRDAATCTIWAVDFPETKQRELMATLGHELKHCFDGPWH